MKASHHLFYLLLILLTTYAHAQLANIPDPNLKQAVREALEIPDDSSITQQEMLRLESLSAWDSEITDLTGLEYATFLSDLGLCKNQIHDLRPLSGLIRLEHLALCVNQIADISPLANLTNLKSLDLGANGRIVNIAPLANLTQLEWMNIGVNMIEDITTLSNLTRLTFLRLDRNQIRDISPLANLTLLEELLLDSNKITDITPLIGLKHLKKLRLANNRIRDFSLLAELEGVELDVDISRLSELNVVVEMPDRNLKEAIRAELDLSDELPLTQLEMSQLTGLEAGERDITNLTGIEYATNLKYVNLGLNQIRDIRPLGSLIHLIGLSLWKNQVQDIAPLATLTNLTDLNLAENAIETVKPLAGLIRLQSLHLAYNRVKDITPLANLTALTKLDLTHNRVSDFGPLANLANLEELWINDNLGVDISPLAHLNLTDFSYDEVCNIAPFLPSVRERLENRSFPSVFHAWGGIGNSKVTNRLDLSDAEQLALHDLHWTGIQFGLNWDITPTEPTYGLATRLAGNLALAHEGRQRRLDQNPNTLFLGQVLIHHHLSLDAYPPDSDFWIRDAQGQVRSVTDEHGYLPLHYLVDFLKPEVQDLIAKRMIAMERCGLYDGVFLDGAGGNGGNRFVGRGFHSATNEEITQAMHNILSTVRAHTRTDFLIIVNSNDKIVDGYTELVNGTFMETFRDHPGGYTRDALYTLESVLTWSEENMRSPQITCLRGEGMSIEPPDGPNNLRWMRVFTTMSLTHSDGYVLYTDGIWFHEHLWHDFWDANLGKPVGPKAEQYQNINGLFIREFTNGWMVYNRSGQPQTIALPTSATPVSDRGNKSASTIHQLPDLDGEIYLTSKSFADVNGDGRVNILDLVQVANGFGRATPDPNGDGVVNILDLVFVAQRFSQ